MTAAELVLLAQGREAEVFLQSDGSVLKLMREPAYGSRVDREAAALRALNNYGYPAPALLGLVTIDGRPGLVMERIPGGNLLMLLGRNPLLLLRAGRAIGEAHAAMHRYEAPAGLPDLKDALRRRIEIAAHLPDHLRAPALALLEGMPRGDRLCHGDLHLGNLLGSWSAPVVIDWAGASRGDPLADVARTDLLQRLADVAPGAPPLIRMLAPAGRKTIAARYLATYRKHHQIDQDQLKRWTTVRAAARLAEPIPSEYPKLVRFLERRLHGKGVK